MAKELDLSRNELRVDSNISDLKRSTPFALFYIASCANLSTLNMNLMFIYKKECF